MIWRLMIILWAVLAATTARADGPWAGEWQLTWGNGGTLVNLKQDGTSVGGSFGNDTLVGGAGPGRRQARRAALGR